ncbi:TPA: DNA methyltransferase [Klebsiella pneumoniae]|uniref:DNA methyltransferase n=1 Tax=Klebsiella TaxID=570 RepID=UPI000A2ED394|nr:MULTISPECIES: DNA methyltransferase [Klebsiella]HCM5255354.1 hypothetical protein [Klebsiella variicola subsp. variicola]MCQ8315148.1 site-specific DNA-methyltransferase [Klebsiella pneumoniae]OSZ17438.1 DNA methylase [Klebsiella quasipneumoniae]HBR1100601.1 hypothetical protein [Klebsiella pneumoniae]HBR1821858.1 hypothetical protein [Klebsiella pneumoniae]
MQQDSLFSSENSKQAQTAGPVTCLGKTFANDQARRDYFLALLAEKLKDPEFRKIEGFPIGSDENILNLSDPPYYTVCPNPWIGDFIVEWEAQKATCSEEYHREPFTADVSEGKNDPIYNAHSYHTKVPHKAIMRYILHYTNPGDIVFDGFCGTGMTGVAAQMCGNKEAIESLNYKVKSDGTILQEEMDESGVVAWKPFSKLGVRKAVLTDLSPAATFISYNYNTPEDMQKLEEEAKLILKEIECEYGWMYETKHIDGRIGRINYAIWSDVFVCPECSKELVFWDVAVDKNAGAVRNEFPCSHCSSVLTKRSMDRAWSTFFDNTINETIRQGKQVPVLINYSVDGILGRLEKKPDENDLQLIQKLSLHIPSTPYPSTRLIEGQETRRNDNIGITHVHHFYTKRNLAVFSAFYSKASNLLKWAVTGCLQRGSKQHQIAITRIGGDKAKEGGATAGHRRGTLYVPSNQVEMNAFTLISDRVSAQIKAKTNIKGTRNIISTESSTNHNVPENSIDYLFIDPPFGANIAYSELNSLQESWLGALTNQKKEAIQDKPQKKSLTDYHELMRACFENAFTALKPGRWMTVEFSNTSASVWNAIQSGLQDAGFIVANVSSLDKKRGGLNSIIGNTAVKQDLAISAYKPNSSFENRFTLEVKTEEGVWDFIHTHLKYIPVTKLQGQTLITIPERDPRILYDQLVAYYVRKNFQVPIDSKEFQVGLAQRFSERDGMYFLPEQAAEYDKKKIISGSLIQTSLFVKDEASAIDWLRQLLKNKPQTFADVNPLYMQQLTGFSKHEITLDLRELLSQNFLCYDGQGDVPDQIHSYLSSNWKELRNLCKDAPALVAKAKDRWYVPDPNKAGDLEKLRDKTLLKEFEEYKSAKKKLKVFRIEAVRTGFKRLWERQEYLALIAVADKLPSNVLEEDPVLLMYYDQAVTLSQVNTDNEW